MPKSLFSFSPTLRVSCKSSFVFNGLLVVESSSFWIFLVLSSGNLNIFKKLSPVTRQLKRFLLLLFFKQLAKNINVYLILLNKSLFSPTWSASNLFWFFNFDNWS